MEEKQVPELLVKKSFLIGIVVLALVDGIYIGSLSALIFNRWAFDAGTIISLALAMILMIILVNSISGLLVGAKFASRQPASPTSSQKTTRGPSSKRKSR